MKIDDVRIHVGRETLAATRVLAAPGHTPSVISFHGTGVIGHRGRVRYLLDELASRGVSSACFDFSGHGQSTGQMATATIASRLGEAFAAATLLCPPAPRAIIGTSMGAHLAAVLLPRLHPHSLILFCPKAYSPDTEELSTEDSPAFDALRPFGGRMVIVVGREDAPISETLVERYAASAPHAETKILRLDGCGHGVHPWLAEHERERAMVVEAIAAAIS